MAHSDFLPAPRPRLADLKSCEDWLARATLADPRQACNALLALLEEIEDAPPRHAAYLQILERLRKPVLLVQDEHAKRFAGKPLPLGHSESAAFVQACDLWSAMQRAYARLWRAALNGGHPELKPSLALLCQRVLACAAELIGTCCLARHEVGEESWQTLHEAWAVAEARGIAEAEVAAWRSESTPTSAYAAALLLMLARPHGFALRELAWARKWIDYWSRKVRLDRDSPAGEAYAVDLAGHCAPLWAGRGDVSATLRFLDLARVGRSLKKRVRKLDEGAEPRALGLGRDCTPQAAGELLKTLAHAWFEAPPAREFPRHAGASPIEFVCGFEQIHAALGGRSSAPGSGQPTYSYREAEQLHVFQRATGAAARQEGRGPGPETWETLAESATEFHLSRKEPGASVAHRQLVALRPRGARQFILCEVRSLCEGPGKTLTLAARALPGLAQPAAVRPTEADPRRAQPLSHVLVLPVAPGLPPSLVVPVGWYQSGRALELGLGNDAKRIKLFGLLERGFDYERVNFTAA
jgi:cyclic-di-GMP-binding protein